MRGESDLKYHRGVRRTSLAMDESIISNDKQLRLNKFLLSIEEMSDTKPYTLIQNVIEVDGSIFSAEKLTSMTKYVINRGTKLFQKVIDDYKRFMHTGEGGGTGWGPHKDAIQVIEEQIQFLIMSYGNLMKKNLNLFTPSLIVSKAGCHRQQWHFDYDACDLCDNNGAIDPAKAEKVKNYFLQSKVASIKGCITR